MSDPTRTAVPAGPADSVVDPAAATGGEAPPAAGVAALPANPPGYELLDEIGHGGMGVVFRARDTALARDVAVKLLAERYPPDSLPAHRFLSEARITGQLQHPGIPAVHQVGTLPDGRPFLAMKLIKGRTLDAILASGPASAGRVDETLGPLTRGRSPGTNAPNLLAIFEAICQAVGYAHAHHVIHRDLKPANVMVGAFGEVQVMDWGLAKVLGESAASPDAPSAEQTRAWTEISPTPEAGSHTQAGSLVGTPAFIPPEQAGGEIDRVDARADVFGLGALLTVILTGKPPYVGESAESVRVQALRGKLDDCFARLAASGAEPGLVALCKRCLAFEPADRPRDGGEVAQAVAGLRAAAEERARTAEREKAAADARAEEQRRKRRWQFAAAGVVALALVGGILGLGVYLRAEAKANADLAAKNTELAAANERERQRFDLALDAIGLFTGDVSQDLLLKEKEFEGLRTKLLTGAATFYGKLEGQLKDQDDPASREALGRAYHDLGMLMAKMGKSPAAIEAFGKALAVRRELAARPGAGPKARLDVARSLGDLAGERYETREIADIIANGREMLDIIGRVEAEHGVTVDTLDLRSSGHMTLGTGYGSAGKQEEARAEFERAVAAQRTVLDARPNDARTISGLANVIYNRGIHSLDVGDMTRALADFRAARDLYARAVAADPGNTAYQHEVVGSQDNLASTLFGLDRLPEAIALFEQAAEGHRKLVAANPLVAPFRRLLAHQRGESGEALALAGRVAEARAALDEGLGMIDPLVKANKDSLRFRSVRADLQTWRCIVELLAGRPEDAAAPVREAHEFWATVMKDENKVVFAAPNLGEVLGYLGLVERAAGRPAQAADLFREAIAHYGKSAFYNAKGAGYLAGFEASLAGLAGVEGSGIDAADGPALADKAMATLRRAVGMGYRRRTWLVKFPAYDPLRGREDFRKLLAEMEAMNAADAAKDKDAGKE